MQIYLARNNQQAGPYTVEQVNQMLASQQILLTDLAWHEGMVEWKALGELTQGKLVYEPAGYIAPPSVPNFDKTQQTYQNPSIHNISVNKKVEPELASIGSRALAKGLDILLWIPAAVIPSFFLNQTQFTALTEIQQKMQAATTSEQALKVQSELFQLIPNEAWIAVGIYIVSMLAIQAILLAKHGQSIGKRLVKIKIVDVNTNEKVSLMRGFTLRSVLFILPTFYLLPFFSIIDYAFSFNKNRQTLHDKLAKTKVVKQ
ncbi:RDD family protein [Acinetobacter faecalis]|uniref:RDD family protein n=1 Tax=Acinetobacter faecalis TaxID=2665161 RepID=UPI002A9085CE|nr:RDD family protein [Acinetobacter faecalis]MDY6455929.1 RDD family protein [Acinetobacter faecalis]